MLSGGRNSATGESKLCWKTPTAVFILFYYNNVRKRCNPSPVLAREKCVKYQLMENGNFFYI